jgi:hypothetical protein
MKKLDKQMLDNIYNMSDKDKMTIIIEFNEIIEYVQELIN